MAKSDIKVNQEVPAMHTPFIQTYFHGTKADLKLGEFLEVGYNSNFGNQHKAKYLYLTATLDPAVWGAELALGNRRERIYLVEPTGPIEDDPNLTDQRFPGNPSMSYRTQHPLKVVGEVTIWQNHPWDQINAMKEGIAKLHARGIGAIE
jgi:rifampin ADP-ribosylating transferase